MRKIILSLSIALLLCNCANAEEKEKTLNKMTDEELIAKIVQSDKEQEEARKKTAIMKEKTKAINKLSKMLQVEK